jgi:tetratricopeptide (TPR) repeat protein
VRAEDAALGARLQQLLAAHEALEADGGACFPRRARRAARLGAARRRGARDRGGCRDRPLPHRAAVGPRRHGASSTWRTTRHWSGRSRSSCCPPTWRRETAKRRFVEEARAASALDHPHIATVYEIGEADDGRLFIAMAYYPGDTLRQRLAAGPLPVAEALRIAAQVADGLGAAHARSIVHRDVKPENLVFGEHGTVKIVDFGVAKVAAAALTQTGATLGTVSYMSPEQTRGEAADHRADLWSLGVVLYEMLAGRRPFAGETNDAVIYGIRHDAPAPLRRLRPEVPAVVAEVVERCLQKDAARRYASAAELRTALGAAATAEPEVTAAAGRWQPLALWAAAYLAAAFVLVRLAAELAGRYLLPAWTQLAAALLLIAGLPVVLAALHARRLDVGRPRRAPPVPLTWPRAVALGAVAFLGLAGISGFMVVQGVPRVIEARGAAGGAFAERGWVVLADVEATDDAAGVALAAREALAVDFQQSGFVNVVGRSQIAGILRRMELPAATPLPLPLALEVAERAGAGAVLTVTIARLGPDYVLSGRAVRPGDGEELFAVRAAAGADRLLGAVETLSRQMRRRLGEQRDELRRSRPLPEVSTPSIAALRLYAEADDLLATDLKAAAALAAEALRLDPGFAMAHRLAGVLASNELRFGDARHHLTRAYELRDRLGERERWHVEAIYHMYVSLQPRHAADAYELLLQRYPDDWRAAHNLGSLLISWLDDQPAAYAQLLRAVELEPEGASALLRVSHAAFFLGRHAEADSLARLAEARGLAGHTMRWQMARAFALGDVRRTALLCDSLRAGLAGSPAQGDDHEFCGAADVASGRLRQGITRLDALERSHYEARRFRNAAHAAQSIAVAHLLRGEHREAGARLEQVLERVPAGAVPEPDRYISRTNLQVQAALLGRLDLVDRLAAAYPPYAEPEHWFGRTGDALVAAARAVAGGDGEAALRVLRDGWRTDLDAIGWRIWNDLLRGLAFEQLARPDSAAHYFDRAVDARYLTLPQLTKHRIYLPIALQRLAAAEEARGDAGAAARAHRRLLALWAEADAELQGEIAAARAALARLGAE